MVTSPGLQSVVADVEAVVTGANVSGGPVRRAMTKGLSESTVAQMVPVAKSRDTVRSISTPFSPCSTESVAKVAGSVTSEALKHRVAGKVTDAVVEISYASAPLAGLSSTSSIGRSG